MLLLLLRNRRNVFWDLECTIFLIERVVAPKKNEECEEVTSAARRKAMQERRGAVEGKGGTGTNRRRKK